MSRAHSTFAASASARLLACPGSFGLTAQAEEQGVVSHSTSFYAAEGTVAHWLLESRLSHRTSAAALSKLVGTTLTESGHTIEVTDEMVAAVEMFVSVATGVSTQAETWVEQRVSLARLWGDETPPVDLFGTADFVAVRRQANALAVIDLKYGRGVGVEVRDNPQLLYYALGSLLDLGLDNDLDPDAEVSIIVVQPRAPHPEGPVRTAVYSVLDVLQWGYEVLRPAVERALEPSAPLVSGSHCRFCPAMAICPALRQVALQTARDDFGPVPPEPITLASGDLGVILGKAEVIEPWIDAIRAEAQRRLEAGQKVPGWKLVPKKSPRRWADTQAAMSALTAAGADLSDLIETKLRTPAQIEKRVSRTVWADAKPFVDATSSGHTLARATDPRPALRQSAQDDFAITNDGDG